MEISIYRFNVGSHEYLLKNLESSYKEIFKKYPNSQTYISYNIKKIEFWPNDWCSLFKIHCIHRWPLNYFLEPKLPKRTRIIAFPGVPNPHDAVIGNGQIDIQIKKNGKKIYKFIKPTSWISDHWT